MNIINRINNNSPKQITNGKDLIVESVSDLMKLVEEFEKAQKAKAETFEFKGMTMYTKFVYYYLQYLDNKVQEDQQKLLKN